MAWNIWIIHRINAMNSHQMFRMKLISLWLVAVMVVLNPLQVPASSAEFRQSLFNHTHQSLSKQFVVHDPLVSDSYPAELNSATNLVKLEPALLAISCDRIKKALLARLHQTDDWHGRIIIFLHHARTADENIVVKPAMYNDNWIYTVEMPDLMQRTRVISGVAELLLFEMANRGADRTAEIPAWLSRGISREIISTTGEELVVEAPHGFENGMTLSRINRTGQSNQKLMNLHQNLGAMTALSVEQLSWPGSDVATNPDGEVFQNSAHLFTRELLQLPNGSVAMRNFIGELPRHLNWQLAFYKAFAAEFAGRRELDKWWDLTVVGFTSRDVAQAMPPAVSRTRLDAILHPEVEIRTAPDQLPMRTRLTLQALIEGWDIPKQLPVLRQKERELLMLRVSSPRDVAAIIEEYRVALENYLVRRENLAVVPQGKAALVARTDDTARETIERLNRLDSSLNPKETQNKSRVKKAPVFPTIP